MRRPAAAETIWRIALHAKHQGDDFFGIYNGAVFEKGCLEPIDFKSLPDAMTIALIQCMNIAADQEFSGKRIICIDKFTREGGDVHILPVAYVHVEGTGCNPVVEEIS